MLLRPISRCRGLYPPMGAVEARAGGEQNDRTASLKVAVHLPGMASRGRACSGGACEPTLHRHAGFSGSSREPSVARTAWHAPPGNSGNAGRDAIGSRLPLRAVCRDGAAAIPTSSRSRGPRCSPLLRRRRGRSVPRQQLPPTRPMPHLRCAPQRPHQMAQASQSPPRRPRFFSCCSSPSCAPHLRSRPDTLSKSYKSKR
jgi:hypothetical protein